MEYDVMKKMCNRKKSETERKKMYNEKEMYSRLNKSGAE
jgi:hypothetical protein